MAQSAPGKETSNPWVASNRAYKVVQEILSRLIEPDEPTAHIPRLTEELAECGHLVVRPLADAMASDDPERRTAAAAVLAYVAQNPQIGCDTETCQRSTAVLHEFLSDTTHGLHGWCCGLMLFLIAPPELKAVLVPLSRSDDELLAAYASAALATIDAGNADLIHTLSRGLRSEDPDVVLASATAFARLGVRSAEALRALAEGLRNPVPECQWQILVALTQLGTDAAPLADDLIRFIDDEHQNDAVRARCARVLGRITHGSEYALATLLRLLSSKNSTIVQGAALGLGEVGTASEHCVVRLASLLSSEDWDIRMCAARALGEIGPDAGAAIPALIERIKVPLDSDEADTTAWALSRLGSAVVPALADVIRGSRLPHIWLAAAVVAFVPDKEFKDFIAIAQQEHDERFLHALLAIARRIGTRIGPAVHLFADALDKAWDDDMAFNILTAIECAGPAGTPAVPSVVRYLLAGTHEQSLAAERVLVNLGHDAAGPIRIAQEHASGKDVARLNAVLARIEGTAGRFRHLEELGNDRLLISFLYVAGCKMHDGNMGYRKMIDRLQSLNGTSPDGLPIKARTLEFHVKRLEQLLSCSLIDGSARKSGVLTPKARELYLEIDQYIRQKYPPDTLLQY